MVTTIRSEERRVTTTPNASMTTLASPTLGLTSDLSMWQVEMTAGAQGPRHVFDTEQVWTVLAGRLRVAVADAEVADMEPGDTIVLRADVERQISATTAVRLLVCGRGNAVARVPGEDTPRGTPPWIA